MKKKLKIVIERTDPMALFPWTAKLYKDGQIVRKGEGRTAYAAFANLVEFTLDEATK